MNSLGGGKLPGKTRFAGRRRTTTRTSGFSVHPETTGGEFKRVAVDGYRLSREDSYELNVKIIGHKTSDLVGYGFWFHSSAPVQIQVEGGSARRTTTAYPNAWNKFGSIWAAPSASRIEVRTRISLRKSGYLFVYGAIAGRLTHEYFSSARPVLLTNMFRFAPEAIFLDRADRSTFEFVEPAQATTKRGELIVKSCNRCGRYLPINYPNEREHLSFSNHCVAAHLLPCSHGTFSKLTNKDDPLDQLRLRYGFQLECRFCKKFTVNAAHNPQRTSAQMKEDAARRRAFELLLQELYEGTPQLRYRHRYGSELADDIWGRFGGKCFRCDADLPTPRAMHLDHTRPLKLLWPLDGTATALCGSCNSEKRDRAPADFYTPQQLAKLSLLTGIPLTLLKNNQPNDDALRRLFERKEWFFKEFLMRPEMTKVRDDKIAGDLVLKALRKVISASRRYRNQKL